VPIRSNPASAIRSNVADRPTRRQVAGGIGALGVLVIGLVGIPIALASLVGWPLPHHVPSGSEAAHALGASIPDSFWPRLFAILAWLAWAYFVVSVVISLVAQVRGRKTGHRSHLVGSSSMAALVTAVLVLGHLRGAYVPAGSTRSGLPSNPPPVVQLLSQTSSGLPLSIPASSAQSTLQPATVNHSVVPGDTLWGLAVQYYGDGEQWPTIFRANVGLSQPGGGALTDAHWIYPGWSLTIPAATQAPSVAPSTAPPLQAPAPAISSTAPTVTSPAEAVPPSTSGASNSGRSSASAAVGVGSRPKGTARAAGKPIASQRPSDSRSALRQHTDSTVPGGATPSRLPLTLHHSKGAPAHHDERPNTRAKVNPPVPNPLGSDIGPIAMGAGLFGLTAIGLVTALDRRRRRQLGRRSFGGRISRPEPKSPLADLELQLRHYARAGQVFWLCHLPELLGRAADLAAVAPPEVLGVELIHDGLDVLVTGDSGEPLAPFTRRPSHPNVWHLPFTTDPGILDEAAASSSVPLALATVSHGAAGAVLVNVSQYRSIHLTVTADQVEGLLAAMATELTSTTAPVGTEVIAVGFGYGVVDRLDGGIVVDDLDDIAVLLRSDLEAIILVDSQVTEDEFLDEVQHQENVHLVMAGPVAPSNTVLVLDPEHQTLEDHAFGSAPPAHVSDQSLEEVQSLFELAEVTPDNQTHFSVEASGMYPSDAGGSVGEVVIGVLGEPTITVDGGDPQDLVGAVSMTAGTKAGRVAELLVYLAAHEGNATRGEWLTDISPEKALSDGYVRNLVLLTRRSLEALTGDPDLLTYDKATQRLSLDQRVTTDWRQFQAASSAGEPVGLRTALKLVRGTPFGVDPDPWTSAGGLSYVVSEAVTDMALTLGEHALEDGDLRLAAWAARQGQLVNRYDQGLWRMRLRGAKDDTARQQIWNELLDLLAVDGDSDKDIEPATLDLYDSLSATARQRSEVIVYQNEDDAVLPTREAV
jgi:cytoskeletal protein RodZ